MMRRLPVLLMMCLLATGLRGETYEDWEKSVPNQTPVPFKGWQPASLTSFNIDEKNYSVFDSPQGYLFGHLDFSSFPAADFPLKIRFLYYHIDPSAVNANPNGSRERVSAWTASIGYLGRDASLDDLIERREIEIKSAAEGAAVPVWSICYPGFRGERREADTPYSLLIEVAGHDGTLLVRKRLIEAVTGITNTEVYLARADSGAEPSFKHLTNRLTTTDELPLEGDVYGNIKVLWLDDVSLRDARYTDDFWQKVFFAHTMVIGHASEVQELAQRLGVSPNQRILLGGLWSIDAPSANTPVQLREKGDKEGGRRVNGITSI